MSVFAVLLLAAVAIVSFGSYVLMSSKFGSATAPAVLGTAIVTAVILAGYAAVLWSRWRAVYERDPQRYRHVIVAVHRGESVALTPDLPYEAAATIVAVLQKVQRRMPKPSTPSRREAAA
jgi:diadenosine tetraphosphate (Ap4A) HIT family hydrolase